ncbi:DUF3237 domain-containing protein [Anaerovorax odorimutans]|uniref:DUF3237 domain-containing protein n=1 Tax=Anaerovorax odorimutans TaxID=109327 RepID=A0ABT1RMS4_9FIRM|nr:DUF3237 domain-containing protein [Anaerovorax odorimutans]MCQ4636477.1 DUF3237 domain-containing protein [Anaerovorax odorimutans]
MIKLFDVEIRQTEDILIEGTAKGDLLISPAVEGSFSGERLKGRVLPVGASTAYTPSAGVNIIHAPVVLKTDDGAKIFMQIDAYLHLKPELEDRLLAGRPVSAGEYYYKGTVRFETGSPEYKWLEMKVFVCECVIENWQTLRFAVYEV